MRFYLKIMVMATLLLVSSVAAQCGTSAPTAKPAESTATAKPAETVKSDKLSGKLQLAGSTTIQPLAEKLAEAFMKLNPNLTIEIQGGGSSVGVTSAGESTVEVGMASREIKDSEKDKYKDLQIFTIAIDGIAIVVNPNVKLPTLTIEQARKIFAGEITNFKDVGGDDGNIVVVSREEGSGTRTAFEELVMTHKDADGKSQVGKIYEKALLQQSNGQIRTTIATTPNAIGYLSLGFLDSSIKTVPIDKVEPTIANVLSGSYKIKRPMNLLTKGAPSPLAKAFIDYILSNDGQTIVGKEYIKVK